MTIAFAGHLLYRFYNGAEFGHFHYIKPNSISLIRESKHHRTGAQLKKEDGLIVVD
jgi:hypothetical protein